MSIIILEKELLGDGMIVYGDLLFLINFCMDFLCFYLSCLLLHQRMPTFRTVVASIVGGAYSVAALFISVNAPISFLADISVLFLMCAIVYLGDGSGALGFIKRVALYFIASALLGGLMTSLFSLFNQMNIFEDLNISIDGVDAWIFALLALLGTVASMLGTRMLRPDISTQGAILKIRGKNGETAELCALIDSGNLATEPISGKSVVFACVEDLKGVIDAPVYEAISQRIPFEDIPFSVASKIRLVAGGSIVGRALLPAIRIENVYIKYGKGEKPLDVYFAFVDKECLGKYGAIVPAQAII